MKFEELHNDKETNDECLLNTVKESLNKGELCLFMFVYERNRDIYVNRRK